MRHNDLDILVTEARPGDSDAATATLTASGHRVHHCHPVESREEQSAMCVAWEPGGRCPLTTADIDLVVDVRTAHGPETPREQGAMCATLAHVSVIVCGPTDTTNRLLLRADVLCAPDRLTLACHTALSPAGPTAHRAVTQAVRAALAGLDAAPPATVRLELRDHAVVVDITIAAPPSATTYPRVRAAVRAALAHFTETWPYTPVTIHHATCPGRETT